MPAGAPRDRPLPAAAPLWPSPWGGALSLPALAMHGWRPSALPGPRTPLHTRPLAVQPLPLGRTSRRPPVPPCLPGRELCSTVRSSTAAPVPCRACQEVPRNLPLLPHGTSLQGWTAGCPSTAGRQRHTHPRTRPVTRGRQQQGRQRSAASWANACAWPQSLPRCGGPSGPGGRHRHQLRAPPISLSLHSPWPEEQCSRTGAVRPALHCAPALPAPLALEGRRRCPAATPPSETMGTGGQGTRVPTQAPGRLYVLYVYPSCMPPSN